MTKANAITAQTPGLNRRQFVGGTLSSTLAASFASGLSARAFGDVALKPELEIGVRAKAFAAALKEKPWLLGFRSVAQDALQATARVQGKIPAALRGTLYRNGPAQHNIGAFPLWPLVRR